MRSNNHQCPSIEFASRGPIFVRVQQMKKTLYSIIIPRTIFENDAWLASAIRSTQFVPKRLTARFKNRSCAGKRLVKRNHYNSVYYGMQMSGPTKEPAKFASTTIVRIGIEKPIGPRNKSDIGRRNRTGRSFKFWRPPRICLKHFITDLNEPLQDF